MRKIILHISVSLDGYFARPDGELDWNLVDDELHTHFNEQLGEMSAFIMGRVTYELMAAAWSPADTDPSSTGPMVEFAGIWRRMPKIVYSRTLDEAAAPDATVRREVDAEEIAALKSRPGRDMTLGGPDLAAAFRQLDLIDEYRIYVHPVLIGRGRRLFPQSDDATDLQLIETRTFGNGVVLLRYACGR
jgi:dihydrofolate reductase